MEFLRGQTLEDALCSGKQIEVREAIKIARDIAAGLMDAHHCGLVHRDIKPANIWLETGIDGSLAGENTDFGLARSDVSELRLTDYGSILGTPAYMAPEQARADRQVDAAPICFRWAACFTKCAPAAPVPSRHDCRDLMALALNAPDEPIKRNPSVPPVLSQLIMHLLQKDPSRRPQSASDVVRQLIRIEGDYVEHIAPTIARSPASTQPARFQPGFGGFWLGLVALPLCCLQLKSSYGTRQTADCSS